MLVRKGTVICSIFMANRHYGAARTVKHVIQQFAELALFIALRNSDDSIQLFKRRKMEYSMIHLWDC